MSIQPNSQINALLFNKRVQSQVLLCTTWDVNISQVFAPAIYK